MRWNGKDAKYDFIELDFGKKDPANPAANRPAKFDGSGQKCVACHKDPDPRPNWETYRAWSGIVPSRDDMIELDNKHGRPVTEGGQPVGMDGRAYLSFLEQVVDTKEGQNITPGADRRLALLDIPVDDQVQFKGRSPAVSSLPPRAQLEAIKAQASQNDGFYRIPHFPYKGAGGAMSNFDQKTADFAGPSQFAFDQMSGQNFCRISQRLMDDKEKYDKFKWFLAGVANCGAGTDLENWIPDSYKKSIVKYFKSQPQVLFSDLVSSGELPATAGMNFSQITNLIQEDTRRNHSRADGFKRDRHQRMGTAYLTAVEAREAAAATTEAEFFSQQFTAPVRSYPQFHAITDVGGVNGVENSQVEELSGLRAVLEPMGIDPGKWSLMRGPNSATDYDSLAFSDQFPLLFSQRAVSQAMEQIRTKDSFRDSNGNACDALKIESQNSLSTIEPEPQENQLSGVSFAALCTSGPLGGLPDPQAVSPILQIMRTEATPRAKELFGRCVRCHGANANATPFEGMENMTISSVLIPAGPGPRSTPTAREVTTPWTDEAWEKFNAFITTGMSYYGDGPMGVEMSQRLRSHSMPSGGWRIPGETPAQKLANDRLRREELASYVELTFALSDNPAGLAQLCRSISNNASSESPTQVVTPIPTGAAPR